MAKQSFEVRKKSARGNGKVIIKGSGGKNNVETLQMARESLGKLVKSGKLKEGVLRCAVLEKGQKKDEWNISAKAKNAPARKARTTKKTTKRSTAKKAS